MVDVEWGVRRTSLKFDRHPDPDGDSGMVGNVYEPEVINVIEKFLRPGDCAIDAGACIGYHTCLMAKLVGETGLVIAFEPQFKAFKYLCHHVHVANKLNNVECLRMALWKCDQHDLNLWSVRDVGYSSFHKYIDSHTYEQVEGRCLDTLLVVEENHPRLIKIDCEGTEPEVLCGAFNVLDRGVDAVIVELNYHLLKETGRSDRVIRDYMKALGYDMFLISIADKERGGFRYPIKVEPEVPILLEHGHHVNVLFSTEQKVRERWS